MDPANLAGACRAFRFPRTRGDGPVTVMPSSAGPVSPARAGMDRGRRAPSMRTWFPPHARGWTGLLLDVHQHAHVSPARAGMDRIPAVTSSEATTFPPHARGWTVDFGHPRGGLAVSPARAGMDRRSRLHPTRRRSFPRTRGDGPDLAVARRAAIVFPPHARGWTLGPSGDPTDGRVSPARAGMDPYRGAVPQNRTRFPRTRGDGPRHLRAFAGGSAPVSPARAGMDPSPGRPSVSTRVSPARAGMDPPAAARVRLEPGFPRTRGDGPDQHQVVELGDLFPPHARGWTADP